MINLQPVLHGPTLTLRPLQPDNFEALYAVASDPLIWDQHPEPTRCQRDVFRKFFDKGIESKGAFLVSERTTGKVLGSSRYYDWNADARELAIGHNNWRSRKAVEKLGGTLSHYAPQDGGGVPHSYAYYTLTRPA